MFTRWHVPFFDEAIADGNRHVSGFATGRRDVVTADHEQGGVSAISDLRDGLRAPLLLGDVQRLGGEVPAGFRKPGRRRFDRDEVENVGTDAADERLARKVPSGCFSAVAPTYIPEVISENFTGSSPRIIVLSPNFTTTGPLLAITVRSEPVIEDIVPLTEIVFPAAPV